MKGTDFFFFCVLDLSSSLINHFFCDISQVDPHTVFGSSPPLGKNPNIFLGTSSTQMIPENEKVLILPFTVQLVL